MAGLGWVSMLAPLSPLLAAIAAASRVAERKLVRALRAAGAIEAGRAVAFTPSNPLARQRLRRLLSADAVRLVPPDRYYLHEPTYATVRTRRRQRAFLVVGVLAAIVLVAWLAGYVRF